MEGQTPLWVDFSVTGAGTTAIHAAQTTAETRGIQNKYLQRYITGLVVDTNGLGSGEYAKVGAWTSGTDVTTSALFTYTNGLHTVDYSSMDGNRGGRPLGPASTALNIVRTGSSTKVNGSVGFYLDR